MRVMPSVTDTIVPTLRASVTDLKPSIRFLMRSLISVALMAMSNPRKKCLGGQVVGDALESGAQRAVDDQIAGTQYGAADQCGIRCALQTDRASQAPLERRCQAVLLRLIERRGGGYRHIDDALGLALELIEEGRDLRQERESPVVRQSADEVAAFLVELRSGDPCHQVSQLRGRDARIAEQ